MKKLLLALVVACTFGATASADIWINEFDYDQPGTDNAEFIELVVADSMLASFDGTSSEIVIETFNETDGARYGSFGYTDLASTGSDSGFNFFVLNIPSNVLQNGGSDAIGISLDDGTKLELISYEGTMTVSQADSVFNGDTSVDVGQSESNGDDPNQSIYLVGTGSTRADFTWTTSSSITNGMTNAGQSFTAVPEPSSLGIIALVGLGLIRRKR